MSRYVLPYPVLPGKTDDDARRIADELRSRPREYEESRRRAGITLERAYLQKTPMGSFVVAYIEADRDLAEQSRLLAESDLDIDRYFLRMVMEVHGADLTDTSVPIETVAAWFDPQATTRGRGLAFCAPLLPDRVDEAKSYLREAYSSSEFERSRRALGQNGEVATLIETQMGPIGAAYLEGRDPVEGNRRFAASHDPFDLSFKDHLSRIFQPGVDFSQPVTGIEEIFDSTSFASLGAQRRVA
jgi:hypothetical protein